MDSSSSVWKCHKSCTSSQVTNSKNLQRFNLWFCVCRNFADILGEERVNTLLALASANNKCFNICSRAFINLEVLDHEYSDVASELFNERVPKDGRGQKVECSTWVKKTKKRN
jgi:hypothetical protein